MFLLSKKSFTEKLTLLPVDFSKPWWTLVVEQKRLVIPIFAITVAAHIFWSLSPLLIAWTFQASSWSAWIGLCVLWCTVDCSYTFATQLNQKFQLQCIHSIYQSAHQYLLTVDPHYHVYRSSGAVLGKIERAARGYEDLLDQITYEFIPLFVGLTSMIVALSYYSLGLMYGISVFFVLMIAGGYYFARNYCGRWEQEFIESDDAFRTTAVENLAQVQLVRAAFASDYMSRKLNAKIKANMQTEGSLWLSYTLVKFILNMVYLSAWFGVLGVLIWQVQHNGLAMASAIGIATAYIHSTKDLVVIVKPLRRYMRAWAAVKDLFGFIPEFGKQTFPSLGFAQEVGKDAVIAIEAKNISFDYETAHLFNHHTFTLKCPQQQTNKLYGIIGPSGSGKTTLLSILGGQLKPIDGTVFINGVDIYSINDSMRRQLIALQGQVATSLRGSVRYNLLFGLPENNNYTDEYLIEILKKVGLMTVLATQKGLETQLGEGGLNLSGGQRQRLNFAGLYLRAHYFKPVMILIDEPTSSLDEISEAAITGMIIELAHTAVTLVVAHRLKTVEKAVGLIDLSLLDEDKEIVPYTPHELQKRSHYYEQLIQGKVELD